MTCERSLKTSSRLQMFDYKNKLEKSQNQNRKDFAISKLRTLLRVARKLW